MRRQCVKTLVKDLSLRFSVGQKLQLNTRNIHDTSLDSEGFFSIITLTLLILFKRFKDKRRPTLLQQFSLVVGFWMESSFTRSVLLLVIIVLFITSITRIPASLGLWSNSDTGFHDAPRSLAMSLICWWHSPNASCVPLKTLKKRRHYLSDVNVPEDDYNYRSHNEMFIGKFCYWTFNRER